MSEQIKIKEKTGYYIIELSGRFMPGGEPDVADVLRDKIGEVAEKSTGGIVLDLRNVDFFASNTIGALMSGYNLLMDKGQKMVLWRPKKYLNDSLKLVRVDKLLSIVDDINEAMDILGLPHESEE
jgi:anti-anti-sigma factor